MKPTALAIAIAALLGLALVRVAADTSSLHDAPQVPAPSPVAAAPPARRPVPVATHRVPDGALSAADQTALVTTYCATCHSERGKAGGLSLANFNAMSAQEQPEVIEKMIRKLRAGMMPPPGAKRPELATIAALTAALESRMDEQAAANPNPGWRPFQRLNRAEYASAVKDLLDLDVDVTPFLPPDTISHGFDNVADAQSFSPTLMEGYLRAAGRITTLALGDPTAAPTSATYRVPRTQSQMRTSTARRSARAAASRWCTCSRPTATTGSAPCCTRSRPVSCSAASSAASSSRSRSTASASRCSTSTSR